MRTPLLALAALLFLVPNASASVTYNGLLPADASIGLPLPFFPPVPNPASHPATQRTDQYNVALGVGDTVTATLTYVDTSGGQLGGNDIDLTLLLPSSAPIPVALTLDFVVAVAQSRITRTACIDAAAESDNKPALGEATTESLTFTVPAGGETGNYALLARGFLLRTAQPYSLTVTVTSGGADVTAARAPAAPAPTVLITTNPHCQLI